MLASRGWPARRPAMTTEASQSSRFGGRIIFFQLVSLREKAPQLDINPRLVSGSWPPCWCARRRRLARHGRRRDRRLGRRLRRARSRVWSERERETGELCRGTDRPPASQIDAFAADLVHQRRALAVRTGTVRHRMNKGPGLGEYICLDGRQAFNLAPTVGQIFQKDRHVVIGILVRIS